MITTQEQARQIVGKLLGSGAFELPLLPQVSQQVVALCNSADVDSRRLAEVVHRDQALAANLLRLANSAAFGGKVAIVSLQQAISRLGLVRIGEIALLVAAQAGVFQVKEHQAVARGLWRHSLVTALFAREIARQRRRNVEGGFLCGLLHDAGKAVILAALGKQGGDVVKKLLPDELLALLDGEHCRAGALLAQSWRLPETVAQAIAHHHAPEQAGPHFEAAAMVALADQLAHATCSDGGPGVRPEDLSGSPLLPRLDLYPDDLQALLAQRDEIRRLADEVG
jgi:putative nucleotidyltransferase with HDIG domain